MLDFTIRVETAEVLRHAAAPTLVFKLVVAQTGGEQTEANDPAATVHSVLLHCQIRIEPTRRRYPEESQTRLRDLFGEPQRWSRTMRSMLWTHAAVVVPAFSLSTRVDLPVPCTYDLSVASAKYFYALDDGEVPLCLLFSGTVYYSLGDGPLQVAQLPWDKESNYRLPVQVWKDMMDHYYPNCVWLCLGKDLFDRIYEFKLRRGLPTWEQALEQLLLRAAEEEVQA